MTALTEGGRVLDEVTSLASRRLRAAIARARVTANGGAAIYPLRARARSTACRISA